MDINALWESALQNPENVEQWDAETVAAMAKHVQLYAENRLDKTRMAAISHTSITETYARRYLMTGLVGFLYQMLHEWEVPLKSRRIVLDPAPVKDNLNLSMIVNTLTPLLELAKQALDKETKSTELKKEANEKSLLDESADVTSQVKQAAAYDDDVAKAMFILIRKLSEFGKEASYNYKTVYNNCKKHKGASAELDELRKRLPGDEYLPRDDNTIELPKNESKAIITEFINNYFEFNPAEHVRSAKNTFTLNDFGMQGDDPAAPSPLLLTSRPHVSDEHKEIYDQLTSSPKVKSAIVTLLQDMQTENAIYALSHAQEFRAYLYPIEESDPTRGALDHIPPADTFHRYEYYVDANYEKIRNITEALYPERACFENAIAVWETFEGETEKECADKFDMHCQQNKNQFRHPLIAINFGAWITLGSFKGNREKINYYSSATDILRKIEERAANDRKLGNELLKKRVEKAKSANIATDGPDAPGLGNYSKTNPSTKVSAQSLGAKKFIDPLTMRRLECANGDPNAIEDIKVIDEIDAEVTKFNELATTRPLTSFEKFQLSELQNRRKRTIDAMDVPDNAEQIDIFGTDENGNFGTRKIYVDRLKND